MAGGSYFIWIPFLLCCVFEASDNRHVHQNVNLVTGRTGHSELDQIISKLPITLPEGIDPKNINITSIVVKTCTGMKEQLARLDSQLRQITHRNSLLDNEAFGLRSEVRLLKLQLAACSSTASTITDSYQIQLQNKMKQLLETDSGMFLILKTLALTREVNSLEGKIKHAANSTETTPEFGVLQRQLQEKTTELNEKIQQIERSHTNSSLILQVISLQTQIWDLEQAKSRRGEAGLQPDRRIIALQDQLDRKISELRGNRDAGSTMLELVSVHSKISVIQRLISVHIEESRTNTIDYQRQWRQKAELLKRKISQLNREESNTELTKEILMLQMEVENLRQLLLNAKKTSDFQLKELRVILEKERKQQENIQKQLEETDYAQAQLIMNIVSIMKELRERVEQPDQTTSTSDATTLQTLLQTKEREYTKAQAEIKELQRKLRLKSEECSGLEERYEQVKTEFEQKIVQLNRTGDSKAALILNVINLHDDLKTLRELISTSDNPERISELQRQLEEKQEDLNSKTADIERLIPNPKIILTIIELQNEIWDLQKKAGNEATSGRIKALQNRVDGLMTEIDDTDDNNTKLVLKIITLQSQVEQLKRQLSQATQATLPELRNDLETTRKELQKYVSELNEKNQTNARLILTVTDLHKQLRDLEREKQSEGQAASATITKLREQLKEKVEEHSRDQAEIKALLNQLNQTEAQCSSFEHKLKEVKTEFEQKIVQLNRTGDSKAALILNVINLHDDLKTLRELISTSDNPERISELQRQLEEKQEDLNSKTADIERLIPNPKIILTIIELQNEIWDLQKKAGNEATSGRIKALQNRVDGLMTEIDDTDDNNTKLVLKIITLQSQVEQLKRQLSQATQATLPELRSDLETTRKELQKYVSELNEKNQTNARLILTVTDLHKQLRNLENERRNDNTTSSLTITYLREQLKAKMVEHSHDQAEIKALQALLQTKEREQAIAQTEVRELQRKLRLKSEECSGLEERYGEVKTEFEQKIAELNRTADSKAALILNVINLHDELNTLRELISTTGDPERISELQRQLEVKQEDLNTKTADIERLIPNPKIILTIIELQNEIWDLQKKAANETTSGRIKALQNRVDGLMTEIDDRDDNNTKLVLKIINLQSQAEQLKRQLLDLQKLGTTQATQLRSDLETTRKELQKYVNELNEKNQTNARLILTVTDLHKQLRNIEREKQSEGQAASATITKLREQLKEKVEEHSRDQAEIKALLNQLNQTEAQCSNFEHKLKDLQNDLDAKMKELQSRSDTVTSLALQISTLTLQLEELKRQLQNTDSETKIKELQKIIDEKTNELDKKTEELKARSAQPQRLLQIITIQTEIEKLANVATTDADYIKIKTLTDHQNYLIDGIQDENNENTKLMFKILAQQEEIVRLKKQKEAQAQAELERIKDLENELEDIRTQIKDKTLVLDSSDMRISNLSAQIMELHKKIKPLEDEISYLKEENAENVEELQKRLDLSKRQLQDSELRLKDADAVNFNSMMEIADLRAKLKAARKLGSKVATQNINELEQQTQTQQRENKKLENTNKDLKQEIKELKMCCNDANTQCDDLQRQLQQSQEDADRLQQQLHEKDANLKQLQQELDKQTTENNNLQYEYSSLQDEKDKLEKDLQELQDRVADVEDKTIHAKKMTFDPNTANPRIALSADNSEMTTSMEILDVPDHPGRFDVLLAVLGKTGFSTGRQYWEVSVAGKRCYHIGMASESAPRKGTPSFSPANGYWTIVLNKQGQYRAIDRRPAAIPVQTQPLTLGILLDYKNGQISFYDAGARSHMYSFAGQRFTDKIYPFVNFCVEEVGIQTPIVLLTPGSVDWIK
ncbi:myosin-2 heavy chain isoform X1 [Dicentrarchus labrax]|uniref:myosin-2 heavy chain isoform X1 n=1 Tax=Dicentrarchus labrax TaxID=13489 RepID=UPI0021F567AE|nr:myosin-2 heavy chain isoform X1 [Dicentrarchus labrax]